MSTVQYPGKHSKLWDGWRAIGRGEDERYFMEHYEAVLESLLGPQPPEQVLLSSRRFDERSSYWEDLATSNSADWFVVDEEKLDRVISVRSSSGLCGVYRPSPHSLCQLSEFPFLLVTWDLQDPGNLGTLLRSSFALAGGGALIVGGCRPYSAKVARASAGTVTRIPLSFCSLSEGESCLGELVERGFQLFSTVPRYGTPLRNLQWPGKSGLLVGHETRGLPTRVQELTKTVTISMEKHSESLNAAVAGSIACYEWSRTAARELC